MSDNSTNSESKATGNLGRRSFLTAGGASVALAFAGCLGNDDSGDDGSGDDGSGGDTGGGTTDGSDMPFEGETLRTTAWSGAYTDRFENTIKEMYEEETGATLQVIPGWTEILSEIRSSPEDNPPYDVTITDGFFYSQGRADDLFLPVRYDNVPNYEGVYPYLKEFRNDNNEHGVPVDGEPIAMIHDSSLDWDPEEWRDLRDPEATNITLEGGFYAYVMQVGAIIADELEGTGEIYDEAYHDAPWEALEELDIAAWYDSGAEIWEHFRQGVADVGQYYYATSKLNARDENMDLDVTVPEVTGGYFDNFCVVRGTDKRDMAEHFLNFLLDPDVQTEWSEESWELKSHQDTEYPDFVAADLPTTNEELQNFEIPDWEYLADYSDEFNQRYEETKQATT